MRGPRLLPDVESCPPARHAAYTGRLRSIDEASRTMLRAIRKQAARSHRHAMGRTIPIEPCSIGRIRARLLSLHRAQSGARRHGLISGRLPVVQLCRECRRRGKLAAAVPSGLREPRAEPRTPRHSIQGAMRGRASAADVEQIRKATRVGCVIGTPRRQRGRPFMAK
jgi:hypothetical protein